MKRKENEIWNKYVIQILINRFGRKKWKKAYKQRKRELKKHFEFVTSKRNCANVANEHQSIREFMAFLNTYKYNKWSQWNISQTEENHSETTIKLEPVPNYWNESISAIRNTTKPKNKTKRKSIMPTMKMDWNKIRKEKNSWKENTSHRNN